MWQEIFEAIAPHLFEMLMSLIFLAVTAAAAAIQRWTGVQVEEKHLRALHSAIRTGATVALDKGLSGDALSAAVRAYVSLSVPGAMKALAPSLDVLETLIQAKVAEVRK